MANKISEVDQRPVWAYQGSVTITKSDSTVIGPNLRGLYVGGAGDVKVRMLDGSTPVFSAVPVGTLLQIQCDQVLSTGTTATLMVGLY